MEYKTEKKSCFWKSVAMLFIGIVIGFLVAPIINAVSMGNDCGNNYCLSDDEEIDE